MASTVEMIGKHTSTDVPKERPISGALLLSLYLALCALSVMPLFLVEHPPILDFSNHAARLFLACNLDQPTIARMYEYRLGIIPNLAVDLINVPLCGIAGPAAVIKGAAAGALGTIYFSGWLIQRKLFGASNAFLLMLPATAWNLVTTMGYTNYLVGTALTFLLLALTIGREKQTTFMLVTCNLFGIAIFFSHIFALLFALALFFGLALKRADKIASQFVKAGLVTTLRFAAPLLLVAFVPSSGEELYINYSDKVRLLLAAFMTPQVSYDYLGLLIFLPLYAAIREKCVLVQPQLEIALLLLLGLVLLIPSAFQGAVDVDSRLFAALIFLFFMALAPVKKAKHISLSVAAVATLFVLKPVYQAFTSWSDFSAQVAEFRSASAILPAGSAVLSAYESQADELDIETPVMSVMYSHLASYATRDRLIFNPLEFTGIGMQPLSSKPPFAAIDTPASLPLGSTVLAKLKSPSAAMVSAAAKANLGFATRWQDKFDYVIYYHFGTPGRFDRKALTEVVHGSYFSILKVQKSGGANLSKARPGKPGTAAL